MLDVEEFADALADAAISVDVAVDGLWCWQAFLTRYLYTEGGHFPNEQAALKVLYFVATERRKNRTSPSGRINAWKPILNALTIHYGDRIQAAS
jgi:hypothetical protein